jgi:hypothetical protein
MLPTTDCRNSSAAKLAATSSCSGLPSSIQGKELLSIFDSWGAAAPAVPPPVALARAALSIVKDCGRDNVLGNCYQPGWAAVYARDDLFPL